MANQIGYQQQQQQYMGFPMPQMPTNPFAQRGQSDLMLLNQLASGFAPVVTAPAQQMRTGFENLPGFNQPGLMGLAMNNFIAPMMQQQMAKQGMVPGGLSSQNILDYQNAQQYRSDQRQIMDEVAGRDEDSYYRTIRGAQALTGQPFNAPQRAAARRLASTAAGMTPSIAPLAPELIDSLAGRTGSAAVMAMRMQQFNRFRTDPVTGLTGFSKDSNIQQAEELFDEMYKPENMANMRGMRAGQMGSMYGEMMKRGMIGSDSRPFRERVTAAAHDAIGADPQAAAQMRETLGMGPGEEIDLEQLDAGQLDKLRGLESVQGGMRGFNTDAAKKSLEGYVEAVTAMREIFGDAGVSNAPMSQLIQGLEALSQGTVTQIDPGSLNMMVRTTQQLAKQSGMTIDAAVMMQQQGASTLQNLGVERNFAPQITQGAMAFGQAATQAGVGANPVWGLENMDFQRQLDQNLRAAAVASPTTNALGAMIRAKDQGGFGVTRRKGEKDDEFAARQAENEPFQRRAAAMATAIEEGRTEYSYEDENGDTQVASLYDDQAMVQSVLIQQGRNQGLSENRAAARAQSIMMQTAENREAGFKHQVGNLTRRLQPEELKRELVQPGVEGVLKTVDDLTDDQREQAAESFANTMFDMDRETAADDKARTSAFADSLRGTVPQRADETDDAYSQRLTNLATDLEDSVNQRIKEDPNYGAYQDVQNLMVQQNESILDDTSLRRRMAGLDAGAKAAVAGLTGHGMLTSLVDAVQDAGEDDGQANMAKVLAKTFGGVQADEISDRLQGPIQEYEKKRVRVQELQRQVRLAKDGPEKRALMVELQTETDQLKQRSDQLRTVAEKNGLLEVEGALDVEDLNAVDDAQETVRQNRLTSATLLLRPDAQREEETDEDYTQRRLAQGEKAGLLGQGPDGKEIVREQALQDELAGGDTDRALALQRGEAELSDTDRLRILEFRQDAIRIAPTEEEVDTAMKDAGVADGDRDVRRMMSGALATENRMRRTGVGREDIRARLNADREGDEKIGVLEDMETEALDAELAGYDVSAEKLTDMTDEGKRRLLLSKRENEAIEEMTAESLTGGVEALTQRREGWESMTEDQRDVVRKGWQDRFDAVQNVIEDTANADFVRRAGGRGLLLRDELKETQGTDARLRRLFGGDAGAAAVLAGGGTTTQQERFADYVETEIGGEEGESRFFDEQGILKAEYATGDLVDPKTKKGLKREDFDRTQSKGLERLAMLGARDAQIQQHENDTKRAEIIGQMRHTLGATGMRFTLAPSETAEKLSKTPEAIKGKLSAERIQALRSAHRLTGGDPDDIGIEDLEGDAEVTGIADAMGRLGEIEPGEQFEAVRKAARSGEKITEETMQPFGDIGMNLEEFKGRVDDFRLVDKETKRAAVRAREADLGDPSKSLSAIGKSLGLEGTRLEELRSNRRLGAKFATGEGQAWAREISGATTAIGGAAEEAGQDPSKVYAAIQKVVQSGAGSRGAAMDELKKLTGRSDVGELVSQGRLLEHGGVLGQLSKEGGVSDPVRLITEALEKLQKSEKTVEDVKDQHITMSGELKLTNWPNSDLAASGGLNTSGIS